MLEKPRLEKPVLVVGLPGIGFIGRNAAGYLADALKAKKFAELHSHHFPPVVLLDHDKQGEMRELSNEFFYYKGKKGGRDAIIVIGDAQSIDAPGHYEIASEIISTAKRAGAVEVVTLGGFPTGKLDEEQHGVAGAGTNEEIIEVFKKLGVKFEDTNIGQIVGASGIIVTEAKRQGMQGICLMGETSGMLLSDPLAAENVLKVLTKHLGVEIDMAQIEERVKKTEKVLKKIEELQRKLVMGLTKKEKPEDIGYIG